jgi:exosortase
MVRSFAQEASRRVLLAVLLGVFVWVFWPTLTALGERWGNDSRYTHGWLVPLFSLYLLWRQRQALKLGSGPAGWEGVMVLLGGLLLGAVGTYLYHDWCNAVALVVGLSGLFVLAYGRAALAVAWPALAFLLFMVPMPFRLEGALAHPLQRLATLASTWSLQTLGFAAFSEGNIIRLGAVRIGVVEACSGLSMLMIFFALCTAVAILLDRPLWERLLVVASAVPIALLANILRIVVTGILYKFAGERLAELFFHDLAGWLMMPVALGLLGAGSLLFSWVFPVDSGDENEPLGPVAPAATGGARPPCCASDPPRIVEVI